MGENGWQHVDEWVQLANGVGPTLVGGSKKHGGADLGPTRAKLAWSKLGVDGRGVANEAPSQDAPPPSVALPKLTIKMVARLQGWNDAFNWEFAGRKTAQYRQIGNAFPPPVAEAVGRSIKAALDQVGPAHEIPELQADLHDPIYRALSGTDGFVAIEKLKSIRADFTQARVERHLAVLARDFHLETKMMTAGLAYRLGKFKGFTGQSDHERHEYMQKHRARIS